MALIDQIVAWLAFDLRHRKTQRLLITLRWEAHSNREEDTRLEKMQISQGPVGTPAGASGYHLVARSDARSLRW